MTASAKSPHEKMLAHNVYFTLNDDSAAARAALIADCRKYLTDHPGSVFFAVGELDTELARPVNDQGFHVALHVVFENRQAHDTYQVAPRHQEFIDANKANWKQVRVFDSNVD